MTHKHPLAEVFGFPIDNQTAEAEHFRKNNLCPFNNKVPNCTKDKAQDPLGVCSVYHNNDVAITCPIRFRESWIVAVDAAEFFFPKGTTWTSLTEVRLKDLNGESAGNIDIVLVSYDTAGKVIDFGALEVQAVYISGNIRRPFEYFMENPQKRKQIDWSQEENYPRPDYLSSSRKRLAPQLIFKGGIINAWRKKSAVALHRGFFETLPELQEVDPADADIAWLVYDLRRNSDGNKYQLHRHKSVYTRFEDSLRQISVSRPGNVDSFISHLQNKLSEKLEGNNPPDTQTLVL